MTVGDLTAFFVDLTRSNEELKKKSPKLHLQKWKPTLKYFLHYNTDTKDLWQQALLIIAQFLMDIISV